MVINLLTSIILIQSITLFFLLICSAVISGAEVAFFSISTTQLDSIQDNYSKEKVLIEKLLKKPKRLLATILVANNFINIALVLLFSNISQIYLSTIDNHLLSLLIEVVVISFIILIFGEILPKIFANRNNLVFARFTAFIIFRLDKFLLFIITIPMSFITNIIEKRFGQKGGNFSVDELSKALELTKQNDTTEEEEKILRGIVNFGNIEISQVMCPRVDIFALSSNLSLDKVLPRLIDNGFSRIPVFENQLDNIIGILYVKDLLPHIKGENFNWISILRPAYFVPENKKLDDLLKEFKSKKMHIAMVVDEYGGTSGLVTLEDLIEEIVGDISDEFDYEDVEYSKIDNSVYLFDAKISLNDFYRISKISSIDNFEKRRGEAETLGGFLTEITQRLPRIREKISFEKIQFTIESVDKKRIKRVKVKLS
ncbi:MAG: gliding motility-associated protein GldE [Flavobacteriales bacterium TMED96]|nr:MAG: gliding motility-associated protein GldE [Flavobacteriales bacterium TMED96]